MIMLTNEIMTLTDKKYQFSFESRTILKIIVLRIVLSFFKKLIGISLTYNIISFVNVIIITHVNFYVKIFF